MKCELQRKISQAKARKGEKKMQARNREKRSAIRKKTKRPNCAVNENCALQTILKIIMKMTH